MRLLTLPDHAKAAWLSETSESEMPVGDDVCVCPGSHQVVVADELADLRPWHAAEMQERDATVAEVVRRERWHPGCGAGLCHSRPEPVSCHVVEHSAVAVPVLARNELEHLREQHGWRRNPRPAGLTRSDPPADPRLVDVAPATSAPASHSDRSRA
jgi:hypothetical protein